MKDEFEKLFEQSDRIMGHPRALERKFTIPERNRAMVREFRDVRQEADLRRFRGWVLVVWQYATRDEATVERKLTASINHDEVVNEQENTPTVATIGYYALTLELKSPVDLLPVSEESEAGLCAESALAPEYGERP